MAENSLDRRFSVLEKKAEQQAQQQQQQAQQGLKRQFSRLGGIGTGAFVKQQQLARESGAKQLSDAKQNIQFQKLAESQRLDEIEKQRAFQRGEREASQQFGAGQSALQRQFSESILGKQQEFARGERLGGQEFSKGMLDMQQKFATGERLSSQDFAAGEAEVQRLWQSGEADKARALQEDMFKHQVRTDWAKLGQSNRALEMENTVNALNARLQIAEGVAQGLFSTDDLNTINKMFGTNINFSETPAQRQQRLVNAGNISQTGVGITASSVPGSVSRSAGTASIGNIRSSLGF